MEGLLLRVFQRQILFEADGVLRADVQVTAALDAGDVDGVFLSLQALLTCAANMSKALWGGTGKAEIAAAREPLRASLGISDESPLRTVAMRNNFEHVDERLDKWWKHSAGHFKADWLVGPFTSDLDDVETFRVFDPETGVLRFWGDTFDVLAVVNEVRRIYPRLKAEADTPHWS